MNTDRIRDVFRGWEITEGDEDLVLTKRGVRDGVEFSAAYAFSHEEIEPWEGRLEVLRDSLEARIR